MKFLKTYNLICEDRISDIVNEVNKKYSIKQEEMNMIINEYDN